MIISVISVLSVAKNAQKDEKSVHFLSISFNFCQIFTQSVRILLSHPEKQTQFVDEVKIAAASSGRLTVLRAWVPARRDPSQ